jgi:hypothetical protein
MWIETNSPLDNLAACAVAYLAGILLTLLLMSYINALLAQERERHKASLPFPDLASCPIRKLKHVGQIRFTANRILER